MSDFLSNLVRRGAGLPPENSPQPPLMVDLPPVVEESENAVEALRPPAVAPASRLGPLERLPRHGAGSVYEQNPSPSLPHADLAATASVQGRHALLPPGGKEADQTGVLEVRESSTAASPHTRPLLDLARSAESMAHTQGVALPPGPQSALASAPTERENPTYPATSGNSSEAVLPISEPRRPVSHFEIRTQPEQSGTPVWPGETGQTFPMDSARSLPAVQEESAQIVPRPTSMWDADVPLTLPHEAEVPAVLVPEVPRVEVRIGRIEIRATPPPVPAPPASPQRPHGFAEYARARRYADRKWY